MVNINDTTLNIIYAKLIAFLESTNQNKMIKQIDENGILENPFAPISKFIVGAVAIDNQNGNCYFGINQEFPNLPLSYTIHAEQSAIANALVNGCTNITDLIITHFPCGHCRQFLSEFFGSHNLNIHVFHDGQFITKTLHDYLPFSFNLEKSNNKINSLYKEKLENQFTIDDFNLKNIKHLSLFQETLKQFNQSYNSYTKSHSAIGLLTNNNQIFTGFCLENSAFNPSLQSVQVAINSLHLNNMKTNDVQHVLFLNGKYPNQNYNELVLKLLFPNATIEILHTIHC